MGLEIVAYSAFYAVSENVLENWDMSQIWGWHEYCMRFVCFKQTYTDDSVVLLAQ